MKMGKNSLLKALVVVLVFANSEEYILGLSSIKYITNNEVTIQSNYEPNNYLKKLELSNNMLKH
jgi:hypothetical protein